MLVTSWGCLALCALCLGLVVAPLSRGQETGAPRKPKPPKAAEGEKKDTSPAPPKLGDPPWRKNEKQLDVARPPTAVTPLPTPHEALALLGIDESQLSSLFDGNPLGDDDEETLVRILFRIPQVPLDDIQRWRKSDPPWSEIVKSPTNWKLEFLHLQGRVTQVERRPLLPEVAKLYDSFDHYFRVTLRPTGASNPVILCARRVPLDWLNAESLDERAEATGLFLKLGGGMEGSAELICAVDRVAWLPDGDSRLAQNSGVRELGQLGMDVGLFDDVRSRNGQRIDGVDRECFYQLLSAIDGAQQQRLRTQAQKIELAALLQKPHGEHGRLTTIRGTAQRITRIVVNDPDIRERFQIKHYFQIDFFIPLGKQTLQIKRGGSEGPAPIYTNGFPAVACVRQLPPTLERLNRRLVEGRSAAELLNEEVTLTGFFFKLWAYKSDFVKSFGEGNIQLSPMFITLEPQLIERPPARTPMMGVTLAAIFVTALVGVWIAVWRMGRGDAKFDREQLKKQFEVPSGRSLNEMGIEAQNEPDFSNLPPPEEE